MMAVRRLGLLLVLALALLRPSSAWPGVNFPPDDVNVKLTSTNLPIVWLDVDGKTIDRYALVTARMKVVHNGEGHLNYADTITHPGQNIDYEGYVSLRYRGNSSFGGDKKPYSFRTLTAPLEAGGVRQKADILGMGQDNNWALLAPYSDKSMMRDLLAFELARPWMEYTPRGQYCELFLDGIYYGVYILTQVVSKGKHRLNLPDPGNGGDAITGGYILEIDRTDEMTYTSRYHPVSPTGAIYYHQYTHFQYKHPDYEEMTAAQVNYINACIDAMEYSLWNYQAGGEPRYEKYLDVTNFIDYQIAEELGHNVDGYRLSGKFFKRRDSEDPRFKMVVWDMNLAYGNADYYQAWRTDTWMYQSNEILNSSYDQFLVPFWWYKLNSNPDYTAALKKRWKQYRRNNLRQERVMAVVDSLASVLTSHGAEQRNSKAWPRWNRYVWPNYYVADNYSSEIAFLKKWITARIAWMDTELGYNPDAILYCDANLDGEVTLADVNAVIDLLLSGHLDLTGDANGDGEISIADVNTIVNEILK